MTAVTRVFCFVSAGWSGCQLGANAACGRGERRRLLSCRRSDGATVSTTLCQRVRMARHGAGAGKRPPVRLVSRKPVPSHPHPDAGRRWWRSHVRCWESSGGVIWGTKASPGCQWVVSTQVRGARRPSCTIPVAPAKLGDWGDCGLLEVSPCPFRVRPKHRQTPFTHCTLGKAPCRQRCRCPTAVAADFRFPDMVPSCGGR